MSSKDRPVFASLFGVDGTAWIPADDDGHLWFSCIVTAGDAKALLDRCGEQARLIFSAGGRASVRVTAAQVVNHIGTMAQVDIDLMRTSKAA